MLYQDLIGTILWGIFIPVNKVPLAKPDKKKIHQAEWIL
jgi:hypothetical protein